MLKKLLVWGMVFTFMSLFVIPVYAIQVPVEISRRRAYPIQSNDITLVSFQATLRVEPNFTTVNASMVIRNDSSSEANITIGIPSKYDDIVTIKQPAVSVEGQNQKLITIRSTQNQEISDMFLPPNWITFAVKLAPGQFKVIKSTFTINNRYDQAELRTIYFPLRLLNLWNKPLNYVQITADLDFYPPYAFEPNPSIPPSEYDTQGRLVWRFLDLRQAEDLQIHFYPVELAVASYLKQKLQGNPDIINIINLYEKMDYDDAILSIANFLEANPSFELNKELKYLKALCHMELFQPGMALEIFNQLEPSPGFEEPLSNVIRNKIIYDKVYLLKIMGKEQEILDYLKEIQPSLTNNEIFIKWVEDEIKRLSPPPPPSEEKNEINEPIDEQNQSQDSIKGQDYDVKYIRILGYNVPIELIFIGTLILIVLIYIIRKRKKRRKKRYIF
ncbi:hypothetical protein JOD02_002133 [Caldicoprobacter guelmensis]|uniref:hypothetical protein n=1 Tax=Caldicoprobacter guelmensis TaxID=1170224 RepID=UPI001959507D|nr:hypothetical protein [Caldicoprobacter guelmensis]MBM7583252.1 hypothetical protein [Caldicoprobacter guelmensis]